MHLNHTVGWDKQQFYSFDCVFKHIVSSVYTILVTATLFLALAFMVEGVLLKMYLSLLLLVNSLFSLHIKSFSP
jgi:hypothetical protein